MASQEETDKKQELMVEAKSLGIKGAHLCGIEKLEEKIAAVKNESSDLNTVAPTVDVVKEPERKKAPRMTIGGTKSMSRDETVARLERENPGYKYILENANVNAAQLEAKGLESTGKYLKNDLICRTDAESYEEFLKDRNIQNERVMHAVYDEGDVPSFDSQVKKPKG